MHFFFPKSFKELLQVMRCCLALVLIIHIKKGIRVLGAPESESTGSLCWPQLCNYSSLLSSLRHLFWSFPSVPYPGLPPCLPLCFTPHQGPPCPSHPARASDQLPTEQPMPTSSAPPAPKLLCQKRDHYQLPMFCRNPNHRPTIKCSINFHSDFQRVSLQQALDGGCRLPRLPEPRILQNSSYF